MMILHSLDAHDQDTPERTSDEGSGGLVIVVPTRNRSRLAIRAIESVLTENSAKTDIVVSDNSTDPNEFAALEHFCKSLNCQNLLYIRPPISMAMAEHWEWAVTQALKPSHISSVMILGDRRVIREGCLNEMTRLAHQHQDQIVVFQQVMIMDLSIPVQVRENAWSGSLVEIDSADLLLANSRSMWMWLVPVLQNCVVPRIVFDQVRAMYGNCFISIAPDYAFGFRALSIVDSILVYDKPLVIGSALHRSNGFSATRGAQTQDYIDFIATNPALQHGLDAAPIPEIITACNVTFNEYELVRLQSRSRPLPRIDWDDYLHQLFYETQTYIDDSALQSHYRSILLNHGYTPLTAAHVNEDQSQSIADRWLISMRNRIGNRLLTKRLRYLHSPSLLMRRLLSDWSLRYFWRLIYFRMKLPVPAWAQHMTTNFDSVDEAIRYLNRFQISHDLDSSHMLSSMRTMNSSLFDSIPFRLIPTHESDD